MIDDDAIAAIPDAVDTQARLSRAQARQLRRGVRVRGTCNYSLRRVYSKLSNGVAAPLTCCHVRGDNNRASDVPREGVHLSEPGKGARSALSIYLKEAGA
jgi:hypothetical protein